MPLVVEEEEDEPVTQAEFVKHSTVLPRPTSIHHWQLRDLVSAADSEHEFYCVHEQRVLLYDSKARQAKVAAALDFTPNSMTHRHGYLAAGGLHGELEVRQVGRDEPLFKGRVGSTVNNALHIARDSGGVARLFVCCNDSSIKVFTLHADMAPGRPACVLRCPAPINYAALSPDGSTLVAVGDCEPTLLYQATPTGYALLTSFTEACDVGMGCAWNTHGSMFASCHQDGAVAAWDARSGACVARLLLPAAARCCKFAAAPLDLLAVSAHEERVLLLDARVWSRRQMVALPPGAPRGGSAESGISGIAFSPAGTRLWVGAEECCVRYDVDTLARRTFGVASVA